MRKIALVGFGKIGQALAAQILDSGHRVIAIDTNQAVKESLENGLFSTSEPGVQASITQSFETNTLSIYADTSPICECDAVIVCIPLLVQHDTGLGIVIDYEPFDSCFRSISQYVHDKVLIALETTVPVGTCRQRITSILSAQGKMHGTDYLLVFSPERIQSTTMRSQLATNPKIIGALNEAALQAGIDLYRSFLPPELIEPVSSLEIAEMIKLTAMVARDVNIALVNQLSMYCDAAKIDFREVLNHVNTDRVSHLLSPGIGVGGHCTPVYPHFLIDNFYDQDLNFSLARESRRVNESMPEYIVNSVCKEFKLQTALLLGLGFRPNVKEDICSPAYQLNHLLRTKEVVTFLHDPLYTEEELKEKGFAAVADIYSKRCDAVFLVTAHDSFKFLDFERLAGKGCKIIVDGRNVYDPLNVVKAGITYRGMGSGWHSYKGADVPADCGPSTESAGNEPRMINSGKEILIKR